MPFLTEVWVCRGPSTWVSIGGGVVQRSVPSVVDRVRSASLSVPFTFQNAEGANNKWSFHYDLLSGGCSRNDRGAEEGTCICGYFVSLASFNWEVGRREPCDWNMAKAACQVYFQAAALISLRNNTGLYRPPAARRLEPDHTDALNTNRAKIKV